MRALRPVMLGLGTLAVLMGLLWIGQGLGYIHWPASSFMLDRREWAIKGALVAAVGVILIVLNRPKRA
ncbi:MAG: hypothetical protein WC804_03425 [Sphingomonas sp.]|jgi:hypothetical protein|uniref:hypothetical protein n=1 Tax=Sphingomonas sp. TaxID=28214 RepID=UPI003564F27F